MGYDWIQLFRVHSYSFVKREKHSFPTCWIECRTMKAGWHICRRAWCPNSRLRQANHLHHKERAETVKASTHILRIGICRCVFFLDILLNFFHDFYHFCIDILLNLLFLIYFHFYWTFVHFLIFSWILQFLENFCIFH